ncbi:MAG: FAD:protein FMN transferase [Spirochaetota bacterium]
MMETKSIKKSLFLIFFLIIFFSSCSSPSQSGSKEAPPAEPESQSQLMLGTSCRITLYDGITQSAFDKAFAAIATVEEHMSVNIPESEVSQINTKAGTGQAHSVSQQTFEVVQEALHIAALSDGAFDPTIGPLVSLWGIGSDDPKIPTEQQIAETLPLIDYQQVEIQESQTSISLPRSQMKLDLGGIAKGYAADEVRTKLAEEGVTSALINLGGNVLTMGTKPDGSLWKIGIQDPASERGDHVIILELEDMSVVTSGPYERYFTGPDGKRYHHILDPEDGYPVRRDITSATIVTASSFLADALSTAIYVMGMESGARLVETLEGVEALFIDADSTIYVTSGLEDQTIPNRLSNDSYSLTPVPEKAN